jgi:hypothetical protein
MTSMPNKPSKWPPPLAAAESWAFEAVSERLAGFDPAEPHVCVPPGMLAMVTYTPRAAGLEERVEILRAGQIVPETFAGGYWQFARGTIVRV